MKSLRSLSLQVFKAALFKADAYQAVKERLFLLYPFLLVKENSSILQKFDLRLFKRVIVLGAGKAAVPMAAACEAILKDRLQDGLIITKYGYAGKLTKIRVIEAGHPLPDQAGYKGTRQIVSLLEAARSDDLILFLTSGGCSALFTAPAASIPLREKQRTTQLLLKAGATIQEMNTVRKHLSLVKGGRSAALGLSGNSNQSGPIRRHRQPSGHHRFRTVCP